MNRLTVYTSASFALAALAIYNAFSKYNQFYPAAVYMYRNNASFLVSLAKALTDS